MAQLKKCPFCGGEPRLIDRLFDGVEIYCTKCKCEMRNFGNKYFGVPDAMEKAIEAWNKRVVEDNPKVETNIYDEEEIHHNCTVQI